MMRKFGALALGMTLIALPVGATPREPEAQAVPVYRLAPDDKVKIDVYGETELSGQYLVGSDGRISFPLIGMVQAGGLTLAQLQDRLTQQLGARYLKHPKVSADIVEYRPFFILGEVNHSGQFPYRVGMTITAAVATASGFTYRANKHSVGIKHFGEAGEHKVKLTPDLLVSPGDTIRVLERFF